MICGNLVDPLMGGIGFACRFASSAITFYVRNSSFYFRSFLFVQWVQFLCIFIFCDKYNLATKVHYINMNMCVYMFLVVVWMFNIMVIVVLAMKFFIHCLKALCS
jgi:hypothetical protein